MNDQTDSNRDRDETWYNQLAVIIAGYPWNPRGGGDVGSGLLKQVLYLVIIIKIRYF